MTAIYLNNLDPESLGWQVVKVTGLGDAGAQRLALVDVVGRSGSAIVSNRPGSSPRQITVQLAGKFSTLKLMETALTRMLAIIGHGLLEVRDARDPEKVCYGFLEGMTDEAADPQYVSNPLARLTLKITCPDPLRFDRVASVIGFGAAYGNIPCGTAPFGPLLRIYGQPTSPFTVTYRGQDGVARQVMGFTLTLGASDYLDIDCDLQTIVKVVAGTPSNAMDTWTTNADGFIVIDPSDAEYDHGSQHPDAGRGWPILELSTGTGLAIYRRAYR
jgi:phage-related protein